MFNVIYTQVVLAELELQQELRDSSSLMDAPILSQRSSRVRTLAQRLTNRLAARSTMPAAEGTLG